MTPKAITLLEFPSNLGLRKTASDLEPGVRFLPAFLRKQHFHARINPRRVVTLEPPEYSMELDAASGVRNAGKIIAYAQEQAVLLSAHLQPDGFALVLGGDCSILIGNALALRQKGEFALFHLDGHTDFMGPEFSRTGGAAGMDLAIVTGHGHAKLTNIQGLEPYFKEQHVWCVGNREYDPGYVQPILDTAIRYVDLKALREMGMEACAAQFLEMVDVNRLDGFFIHLDVDVLNDGIMPAVDSRQPDGLEYSELMAILGRLLDSPGAIGMEITILDPNLDKDGKHTREFVASLVNAFDLQNMR